MSTARAVRAYTDREKIVAIEGAYHGSSDSLYPSVGIPRDLSAKLIRVPFNDADALETRVKELEGELAAVFIEPVMNQAGGLAPREGYLKAIREITKEHDIPLVFDEVVTGFRLGLGGAAERFGVEPDMTVFGKIIGGGFSGAAFGGRKEIMDMFAYPVTNSLEVINPTIRHPGTYNDHKISMVAGLATLNELKPNVYEHLENVGRRIRDGLKQLCIELGIEAQVLGIASIFHIYFTDKEIVDIASARRANVLLSRYYDMGMANNGVSLAKAHASFCSAPLTDEDVAKTLNAMETTLNAMRPIMREVAPNLVA